MTEILKLNTSMLVFFLIMMNFIRWKHHEKRICMYCKNSLSI